MARELFEFLANNSSEEWGMISIGQVSTGPKVQDTRITTSHEKESNKSLSNLVDKYLDAAHGSGRLILEVTHSHPATPGVNGSVPSGFHADGSKGPLVGDREKAAEIEADYRKNRVLLGVYDVRTKRYSYYNSQTFIRR